MREDDNYNARVTRFAALPYDPLTDMITEDELEEVQKLSDVLVSFYEIIRQLESNMSGSGHASLRQTTTNLQHLDDLFGSMVSQTRGDLDNSHVKTAVKIMLEKLTIYWKKLIIHPAPSTYTIASILHLKVPVAQFHDHWPHHVTWLKKAESALENTFKAYQDSEKGDDEDIQPTINHRKVPSGNHWEERYCQVMAVDLTILLMIKATRRKGQPTNLTSLMLHTESICLKMALSCKDNWSGGCSEPRSSILPFSR